jgi:hypothetical protein
MIVIIARIRQTAEPNDVCGQPPGFARKSRSGTAAERAGSSRGEVVLRGRFDYLLLDYTWILEPMLLEELRLGRRMALTLPLFPPPQKN